MKHLTRIGRGVSVFSVVYTLITIGMSKSTTPIPFMALLAIPFILYIIGYATEGLFSFNIHERNNIKRDEERIDILKRDVFSMLDEIDSIKDKETREFICSITSRHIVRTDNLITKLNNELQSLNTLREKMVAVVAKLSKKEDV